MIDLDLTALGSSVIEGIERIDLTGTGDNSLTLQINDLLQLSDETNDLFVAGDTGDSVTLSGSWNNDGAINIDGTNYVQFTVTGINASIFVEDDVTAAIV